MSIRINRDTIGALERLAEQFDELCTPTSVRQWVSARLSEADAIDSRARRIGALAVELVRDLPSELDDIYEATRTVGLALLNEFEDMHTGVGPMVEEAPDGR